jgi:hypothetical protein
MKNKEVEQKEIKMQNEMNKFCLKEGHPNLIQDFKIVAIGWLDSSESFEKGEVSKSFMTKLRLLWNEGLILATLGFHECNFCEGGYGTGDRARSSREKVLMDKENKIKYIIPEMIFHYIEKHKYKPQKEFIEFVMKT